LLGDIFDFWRRNNAEIFMDCSEVLSTLFEMQTSNIHYLAGNHDHYILELRERYGDSYPFQVSKYLRLEDNGEKFYFMHGYEFEVLLNLEPLSIEAYEKFSQKMCFSENIVGGIAGRLWDFLQKSTRSIDRVIDEMKKTPKERGKRKGIREFAESVGSYPLIGMNPCENLIFGHTHRPFISDDKTVANTGSWVDEESKELQNSYVEILDGQMGLKFF